MVEINDYKLVNMPNKLIRLIFICLIIAVIFVSLPISVLANNIPAGFVAGTKIATPNGNVSIENLEKGDRVIGYNFETHRRIENTVKEIKQHSSLGYYLINDKTKFASPNLVYVRTLIAPELVRLNKITPENKLFGNTRSIVVNSIEQKIELANIYQIVLNNRLGNVYADNILIHVGYELPAYFKNQHVDCKPGTPYFKQCANVNAKTLPGFLAALGIIAIGLTIVSKSIDKLFGYMSDKS